MGTITGNPFFMDFLKGCQLVGILAIIEEDISRAGQFYIEIETELSIIDDQAILQIIETSTYSTIPTITDISTVKCDSLLPSTHLTTCGQFENYWDVANDIVESLFKDVQVLPSRSSSGIEEDETAKSKFTKWPTIEEFTGEIGMSSIEEYINLNWKLEDNWRHTIYLILKQSDECTDYYTYRTIWSMPNKEYPIPQAYGCIYFIIAVSRVKPVNCDVNVSFYYEGCTYHFNPLNTVLNEDYLYKIVVSKLQLYQKLRF